VSRSRVAKWPESGATTSTFGVAFPLPARFSEVQQSAEGGRHDRLFVIDTSRPSTITVSMPKGGCEC